MSNQAEKVITSQVIILSLSLYLKRKSDWTLLLLWAVLGISSYCQQTLAAPASFPSMVKIPSGTFLMGCDLGKQCHADELPVHPVKIQRFYMSATEITFAQWGACVAARACRKPDDETWGRDQRPVINVSWKDIQQDYLPWINKIRTDNTSRGDYRLPTEAEWEYATRAGSKTQYSWGDNIQCSQALFGYSNYECGKQEKTDLVAQYAPNSFGLYDMHGNVWEWVADCWHSTYQGAPANGYPAWEQANKGNCHRRIIRGGSWAENDGYLRSVFRNAYQPRGRFMHIGFRVVQSSVP